MKLKINASPPQSRQVDRTEDERAYMHLRASVQDEDLLVCALRNGRSARLSFNAQQTLCIYGLTYEYPFKLCQAGMMHLRFTVLHKPSHSYALLSK